MAIDPAREYAPPQHRERELEPLRQSAQKEYARQVERAQTRDRLGLIGVMLLCLGIALFLVSRYASLVENNYRIEQMKMTLSHEMTQNSALQSIVYELSSPTRILDFAETVLKMSPATPVVVRTNGH